MDVLKALGSSVSLWYLLIGLVAFGMCLFVWPRTRRFAKHWLLWVTGVYVVFGLPVVASAIVASLPTVAGSPVQRPVRDLIILDGDNRRGRLQEALRILEADSPDSVWILGDKWFLDELEILGYARDRFRHETKTSNTREQIDWVGRFVAEHPGSTPVVVASRLQMPRIVRLARAKGIDVGLVASPIDVEPAASGWQVWVPSYLALRASRDAVYEHAALSYYRWKGWI